MVIGIGETKTISPIPKNIEPKSNDASNDVPCRRRNAVLGVEAVLRVCLVCSLDDVNPDHGQQSGS